MGKGMVKRSSQINVIGNSVYVVAAVIFLLSGYGLFAVVASQGLSVIVIRVLSYKSFYTNDIKAVLTNSSDMRYREVLKSIAPNAVKLGLTTFGVCNQQVEYVHRVVVCPTRTDGILWHIAADNPYRGSGVDIDYQGLYAQDMPMACGAQQ